MSDLPHSAPWASDLPCLLLVFCECSSVQGGDPFFDASPCQHQRGTLDTHMGRCVGLDASGCPPAISSVGRPAAAPRPLPDTVLLCPATAKGRGWVVGADSSHECHKDGPSRQRRRARLGPFFRGEPPAGGSGTHSAQRSVTTRDWGIGGRGEVAPSPLASHLVAPTTRADAGVPRLLAHGSTTF